MEKWEKEYWALVEKHGEGAHIDFLRQVRDFVSKTLNKDLATLKSIEQEKWKDAKHYSCLGYAIWVLENPTECENSDEEGSCRPSHSKPAQCVRHMEPLKLDNKTKEVLS